MFIIIILDSENCKKIKFPIDKYFFLRTQNFSYQKLFQSGLWS